ncbi:hypothetical protein GPECTOR_3g176 [Gonium pectorale]|uniref:Uncharacterized protein n=1 Tax=Gonium pectorale TaxID=33097 RepID=A0A150GZ46_GONPE|nr:hypothetical protein GPECTOR_3g176 [Gonium pectorale]|eukprot:KXZ55013.1 hypothetical protein GPECTOR_3g176 [Gonium pectorale]
MSGAKAKPREPRDPSQLLVNLSACRYPLVREAAERLGYRVADDETEPWDLFWSDLSVRPGTGGRGLGPGGGQRAAGGQGRGKPQLRRANGASWVHGAQAVSVDRVQRLLPFQRLNHFPGMLEICRKAALSRHMARMARAEAAAAGLASGGGGGGAAGGEAGGGGGGSGVVTYILKPSAGTQGRGISLVQFPSQLAEAGDVSGCVAQAYLGSPLLLDGFKFDLRVYALVASVDPLRIHLYDEGLARLATQPYKPPNPTNLRAATMHLTNYAVNKGSAGFVSSDSAAAAAADGGGGASKRPMSVVLDQLAAAHGTSREALMASIADIVTKTVMAIQPLLAHTYHTSLSPVASTTMPPPCATPSLDHVAGCSASACSAADPAAASCGCSPSLCFELLGFDILFDSSLQPWLLEVNHSPSLDRVVKGGLITRAVRMLRQRPEARAAFQEAEARAQNERLYNANTNAASSPAAIAAALAAGSGLGGRRVMSAVPRNRHLQATAAALEELTANSAALLAAGGHVWGGSGSSGRPYSGVGAGWRPPSSAIAGSTSSATTGMEGHHAQRRGDAGTGGGGAHAEGDADGSGSFRLVYPVADESERRRYLRVLQTAADLFPQQRCQCAWCSRRREVALLTSTGQQLGAAARPLSAAHHHIGGLSGHLPMRPASLGMPRRSGSASASLRRQQQQPRRSTTPGVDGASGREDGSGGAGAGDAAEAAAASAPGRAEGSWGRPPRPSSRAHNPRAHGEGTGPSPPASAPLPYVAYVTHGSSGPSGPVPLLLQGRPPSSHLGAGASGGSGGGGGAALRGLSGESSLSSVPGEGGGGGIVAWRGGAGADHADHSAAHGYGSGRTLGAAGQDGSGSGKLLAPCSSSRTEPSVTSGTALGDAAAAATAAAHGPHGLSNLMLSALRPLLHSLSQPEPGSRTASQLQPPIAAWRKASAGSGAAAAAAGRAASRNAAPKTGGKPYGRDAGAAAGGRAVCISPVGSSDGGKSDDDLEGLRRSHSYSELEAAMRRAAAAAAAAGPAGPAAAPPSSRRPAASSSVLDCAQPWSTGTGGARRDPLHQHGLHGQQQRRGRVSGASAASSDRGGSGHAATPAGQDGRPRRHAGAAGACGVEGPVAGGAATRGSDVEGDGASLTSAGPAAAAATTTATALSLRTAFASTRKNASLSGRLGGNGGAEAAPSSAAPAPGVPRVAYMAPKTRGAAAMSPSDLELLMVRIRTASALSNRFVSVYTQDTQESLSTRPSR